MMTSAGQLFFFLPRILPFNVWNSRSLRYSNESEYIPPEEFLFLSLEDRSLKFISKPVHSSRYAHHRYNTRIIDVGNDEFLILLDLAPTPP